MKIPGPLAKQLEGLQKEIDQRKLEAEADTAAAYGLLLCLVNQHEEAFEKASELDPKISIMYERICDRFDELMESGGKQ